MFESRAEKIRKKREELGVERTGLPSFDAAIASESAETAEATEATAAKYAAVNKAGNLSGYSGSADPAELAAYVNALSHTNCFRADFFPRRDTPKSTKPLNELSKSAEDDKAAPKDAEIPLIQPQPAAKAPAAAPKAPAKPAADTGAQPKISLPKIEEEESIDLFGDKDNAGAISQDLFSQMSELEKRTALLNLELRREKLQNEIEAVKNQRRQALQQEEDKKVAALKAKEAKAKK